MYKNLPRGTKLSITYSIKRAFVLYMESIDWNDDKYSSEAFVQYWKRYSGEQSSWVKEIDANLLADQEFQEKLLTKINENIKKIFEESPTEQQIQEISSLLKHSELEDVDYCCKAEADLRISQLKKSLDTNKI